MARLGPRSTWATTAASPISPRPWARRCSPCSALPIQQFGPRAGRMCRLCAGIHDLERQFDLTCPLPDLRGVYDAVVVKTSESEHGYLGLSRTSCSCCRPRPGDQEGFNLLVLRYRNELVGYLARMVLNYAVGEELAQETFMRAYRSRHTYEPLGPVQDVALRDRPAPGVELDPGLEAQAPLRAAGRELPGRPSARIRRPDPAGRCRGDAERCGARRAEKPWRACPSASARSSSCTNIRI